MIGPAPLQADARDRTIGIKKETCEKIVDAMSTLKEQGKEWVLPSEITKILGKRYGKTLYPALVLLARQKFVEITEDELNRRYRLINNDLSHLVTKTRTCSKCSTKIEYTTNGFAMHLKDHANAPRIIMNLIKTRPNDEWHIREINRSLALPKKILAVEIKSLKEQGSVVIIKRLVSLPNKAPHNLGG